MDHKLPHDEISKQLKLYYKQTDLLIIIGTCHSYGYAMYGLPGTVVRFDSHGDVTDIVGIAQTIP